MAHVPPPLRSFFRPPSSTTASSFSTVGGGSALSASSSLSFLGLGGGLADDDGAGVAADLAASDPSRLSALRRRMNDSASGDTSKKDGGEGAAVAEARPHAAQSGGGGGGTPGAGGTDAEAGGATSAAAVEDESAPPSAGPPSVIADAAVASSISSSVPSLPRRMPSPLRRPASRETSDDEKKDGSDAFRVPRNRYPVLRSWEEQLLRTREEILAAAAADRDGNDDRVRAFVEGHLGMGTGTNQHRKRKGASSASASLAAADLHPSSSVGASAAALSAADLWSDAAVLCGGWNDEDPATARQARWMRELDARAAAAARAEEWLEMARTSREAYLDTHTVPHSHSTPPGFNCDPRLELYCMRVARRRRESRIHPPRRATESLHELDREAIVKEMQATRTPKAISRKLPLSPEQNEWNKRRTKADAYLSDLFCNQQEESEEELVDQDELSNFDEYDSGEYMRNDGERAEDEQTMATKNVASATAAAATGANDANAADDDVYGSKEGEPFRGAGRGDLPRQPAELLHDLYREAIVNKMEDDDVPHPPSPGANQEETGEAGTAQTPGHSAPACHIAKEEEDEDATASPSPELQEGRDAGTGQTAGRPGPLTMDDTRRTAAPNQPGSPAVGQGGKRVRTQRVMALASQILTTTQETDHVDHLHELPPTYGKQQPLLIVLLYQPEDRKTLSDLVCLVRSQIEVFAATTNDVNNRAPRGGIWDNVDVGRVGIRCVHCVGGRPGAICAHPVGGAVSYPKSIRLVYQAVRNWQRNHLLACPSIPAEVKREYLALKSLKRQRRSSKDSTWYWEESCRKLGLVDTDVGIRLRRGAFDAHVGLDNAEAIGGETATSVVLPDEIRASSGSSAAFRSGRFPGVDGGEAQTLTKEHSVAMRKLSMPTHEFDLDQEGTEAVNNANVGSVVGDNCSPSLGNLFVSEENLRRQVGAVLRKYQSAVNIAMSKSSSSSTVARTTR